MMLPVPSLCLLLVESVLASREVAWSDCGRLTSRRDVGFSRSTADHSAFRVKQAVETMNERIRLCFYEIDGTLLGNLSTARHMNP